MTSSSVVIGRCVMGWFSLACVQTPQGQGRWHSCWWSWLRTWPGSGIYGTNYFWQVSETVSGSVLQPWTVAHQAPLSRNFPGKKTGMGCQFLLQGIFPMQELNPDLLHCTFFTIWANKDKLIEPQMLIIIVITGGRIIKIIPFLYLWAMFNITFILFLC